MILCPNCRAPNPDSFRFCGRCGKPLREEKAEEPPKGEQVPSWLRELGKGLEVGPRPSLRREEAPAEEAAGLPPWLAEAAPEAPAEEAGLPPWLAEAPAEEAAGLPPWLAEAAPEAPAEEAAGLPPWLAEAAPEAPAGEAAGLPPWLAEAPAEAPTEEAAGLPPWLAEAPAKAPAEEAAGLPPWLAEAPAEAPTETPAEGLAEVPEKVPGLIAEEELELPPWLAEAPAKVLEEAAPGVPAEEVPAVAEEALPPWLEEAPPGVPAEEVPAVAEEALPPWLEEAVPEVPAEEVPAVAEEALPPWLEEAPPGVPAEEVPAVAEEALPPWLEEAAPVVPAEEVPAVAEEALPPWLEKAVPEVPAEEVPAVAAPEVSLPCLEEVVPEAPVEAPPEEELYALPVTPEEEAALPEWARALKPVEEEAPPPFLEGVELPEWLRTEERPAEEAVEVPAPELAWLERLAGEEVEEEVPALAAIERLPRPPLPPLSPARRQAAELFAALAAAPEPERRPLAKRAPGLSQRLLRWLGERWPMLALALLMIVMLAANVSLPGVRVPVSEAEQAFTTVEQAIAWSPEAGESPRPVLVAFDWELHRVGEMRPLALVVVRHLLKWKSPVIAVSTTFQGSQLAQEVVETALLEVLPKGNVYGEPGAGQVFQSIEQLVAQGYSRDFQDYTYGDHFVNLGLRTGAESALRLLADQPLAWTFPRDFLYGLPSDDYPLLKRVSSLEDISLLVVMVGEEDRALGWLEQVISRYPDKPCLLVIPAELGPLVQPYRQARAGSPALLRGVVAAAQYEALLRERELVFLSPELSVERRLSLLTAAQFGLVILILAGNLAQLGRLRKRPPQA